MGVANESEIYRIGENYTFDAVHAVLKHSSCVQKTMTEREAKLLQMLCKKKNETSETGYYSFKTIGIRRMIFLHHVVSMFLLLDLENCLLMMNGYR